MITTALTSSCHRKTLAPFCLRKKRPENAFLTLIGTIGNISFRNIATMQINRNNDNDFVFFKITVTEIVMPIFITKNNTYLLQNNTNRSF